MDKLYDEKTGEEITIGSIRKTFRGEPVVICGWRAPLHPGSTGRVIVNFEGQEGVQEFYPSVVGAVIA